MIDRFPRHTHEGLKFYVYIYIDPRNGEVFYVGKGRGNRAFEHLKDTSERRKAIRIREILAYGKKPEIKILIHGLPDEEAALKVEAAVIDLLGTELLTNGVRGSGSRTYGIMTLDQVISKYDALPAEISDPVCIIRINQRFRYGMSDQELYDSTRGIWRIAPHRRQPTFALAVYSGVVQEVYRIAQWFPAGSTFYSTRSEEIDGRSLGADSDRFEFVGSIAESDVRKRYRFRKVTKYLSRNSQSPVLYVNC